jgi:FAD/FMN-containing dehydrogenase
MGNNTSSPLQQCLTQAVGGDASLLAFPSDPLYQLTAVKPYNLADPVTPAAVTWPKTNEHVAGIIQCAAEGNLKVQPRGGGHSFANYCGFPEAATSGC